GDLLVQKRLAHTLDDLGGGAGAHVGEVELLFQLGEEALVDPAAQAEQPGDAGEDAARLGQARLDLVEDGTQDHALTPDPLPQLLDFLGGHRTRPDPTAARSVTVAAAGDRQTEFPRPGPHLSSPAAPPP